MSLGLMHPPGAYNPRAPQHVEFGSVRRAPVLMRPIVGKRAIEHAAQSLAEQQAADERKRSEWQQHVWQENLAQQTSALSRGAEHAFRNQMYARQLEGELKVANARLSRAENRMARTEHELHNVLRDSRQQQQQQSQQQPQPQHRVAPKKRPQSAGVAQHRQRAASGRQGPPGASSARSALELHHPDHADLDEELLPAWVPGLGDPKPQPTMRWANARGPCETAEMHRRRAPQAPKLKANRVPVSRAVMLNGAGARDALAPPDGWDGPYRVRRPTGPVGPRELVVGLAPKNDHEHMPFRRALEAQYRRTAHASERTVAQRRLEDDMMSTTKLHYPRTETRSIN
jgi:hypothetical protein